ncbi:hypothetical protein D0A34_26310 [Microcoleus vaginatus PCC 9802]|nr:hypothetical protein D0A34_26310 [Microcoleus vaginatus PCC 9802]
MDRVKIDSKHSSAGAQWLAAHFFAKSQAHRSVLFALPATRSALRGKQPSCWISLARSTVGGGETS